MNIRNIQPCTAKIRPFTDDREVVCYLYEHDLSMRHVGYVSHYGSYSSTEFQWTENDRRNFRGEWVPCEVNACIFPKNHRGAHAV